MNRRNAHAVTDDFMGVKFAVDPDFVAEGGSVVFVMDENMKQILKFHHMTGGEKNERHK